MPDSVVLVASAHSHRAYNCTRRTRLVTSAGSRGDFVTVVDLTVDTATQSVVSAVATNVTVGTDPEDATVAAMIAGYDAKVAPLRDRQIATISANLTNAPNTAGESVLGDVVTDRMRAASSEAQGAVINRGGIRAPLVFARSGAETSDGIVTYGEAYAVLPFANLLSTVSVSGAELATLLDTAALNNNPLQVSGISYTWHAGVMPSVAVADVAIGGVPIVATDTYRIVVNSIVLELLPNATNAVGLGIDLDRFTEYLTAQSPLNLPTTPRITAL